MPAPVVAAALPAVAKVAGGGAIKATAGTALKSAASKIGTSSIGRSISQISSKQAIKSAASQAASKGGENKTKTDNGPKNTPSRSSGAKDHLQQTLQQVPKAFAETNNNKYLMPPQPVNHSGGGRLVDSNTPDLGRL